MAFDPPNDFHSYAQYKVKAKSQKSSYFLIFSGEEETNEIVNQLALYQVTEERLKARCTVRGPSNAEVEIAGTILRLYCYHFRPFMCMR